jgi:hypothetical protein
VEHPDNNAPSDHVAQCVILLDNFYCRCIRNFRVFGDLNSVGVVLEVDTDHNGLDVRLFTFFEDVKLVTVGCIHRLRE